VTSLEDLSQVDPRILAVMRDVGDVSDAGASSEPDGSASSTGEAPPQRSDGSSWLNESPDESLLRFRRAPQTPGTNGHDTGHE
jgi:hypothetical protein